MPEVPDIWSKLDTEIVGAIEDRLVQLQGDDWCRLSSEEVRAQYPTRDYLCGWRLSITFSDNFVRRLDILLTQGYPTFVPRTALLDRPPFLEWPHIEEDGVLCLLDNSAAVDPDAPVQVLENLMGRSCRLIEELLDGAIIEKDFRDEFLTYWAYDVNDGRHVYSLLRPQGPSREISIWHGKSFSVVAENHADLVAWLANRYPATKGHPHLARGIFVWHEVPMLPNQYPHSARQLLREIEGGGDPATAALNDLMGSVKGSIVCVFGAVGRHGPGLCMAELDRPRDTTRSRGKRDVLSRGYRPGHVPLELAIERYFSGRKIKRMKVQRADQAWIHGRGKDPRSARLSESTATVLGCGSIGSEVAALLLKAGVGILHLVDVDRLEWANVGRHRLGGDSVGLLKAKELALRLKREFPHATVVAHDSAIQQVVYDEPDWFTEAKVIVCATGSGHADKAVNSWQRASRRVTCVVYGWTEPLAGAGHAVAIGAEGGCLSAGVDHLGRSTVEMTAWNPESIRLEEPACGVHFAPYGAIELAYINAMIADMALDCLLGRISNSTHRAWLARKSVLDENGGSWTAMAFNAMEGDDRGGRSVDLKWASCDCCQMSSVELDDEAA